MTDYCNQPDTYYINPAEYYCKTRIENWYINTSTNQIFGYINSCCDGCSYKLNNVILAYLDSYVIVRVGCKNYALILGEMAPCKGRSRCKYIKYLLTKAPKTCVQV